MARSRGPILPSRSSRPRWVNRAGALVVAVILAAVIFALAFRAEQDTAPQPVPTPIVAPQQQ